MYIYIIVHTYLQFGRLKRRNKKMKKKIKGEMTEQSM